MRSIFTQDKGVGLSLIAPTFMAHNAGVLHTRCSVRNAYRWRLRRSIAQCCCVKTEGKAVLGILLLILLTRFWHERVDLGKEDYLNNDCCMAQRVYFGWAVENNIGGNIIIKSKYCFELYVWTADSRANLLPSWEEEHILSELLPFPARFPS